MHTLARKYTEDVYLTYEELKERFLAAQMDTIWQEIACYRELFVIALSKEEFIVNSVTLQRKHAKIEQRMNLVLRKVKQNAEKGIEEIGVSHSTIHMMEKMYETQYHCSLRHICRTLMVDYSDTVRFIEEQSDLPLFVLLYKIVSIPEHSTKNLLLLYLSFETGTSPLLFQLAELAVTWPSEHDHTKNYASWLQRIDDFFIQKLKEKQNQQPALYLKELRLMERYPTLKPYQASFFEQHREIGHYYTVEQFLLYCNTCYETARMGMEELVRLGWYQKEKVGKKYVYYVSET